MAASWRIWRRPALGAAPGHDGESPVIGGILSDFILGIQDGLVNVLGVILGIAMVTADLRIVLVAGLAAGLAESVSMMSVAYTSTLARRDHYAAQRAKELREMRELPEVERAEVREILARWGFEGKDLEEMLDRIVAKERAWLEIMMAHELELAPVRDTQPRRSAVLVGASSMLGSLIPLLPFAFTPVVRTGVFWAVGASAVALFLVGVAKGRLTLGRAGASGAHMVAIGIASAMAGFLVGLLFSVPLR